MNRLMVEELYSGFLKGFVAFNAMFAFSAYAVQSDTFVSTAKIILS